MFGYYLDLALRSLKRSKVLTALMVLAIGVGIGASMTMITVLHVMSGDPLPERSALLFYPHLDTDGSTRNSSAHPHASDNLSWPDAQHLLHEKRAQRQAAMAGAVAAFQSTQGSALPLLAAGHYVTANFFPMFGVTFRAGGGWISTQDEQRAHVVVLSGELNKKLFGSQSGIGKTVRLKDADFRVIGVLGDWHPQPVFYADLNDGAFSTEDDFFLPLQTALDMKLKFNGGLSCHGDGADDRLSERCTWLQFWVQLKDAAQVTSYRQFLANYWQQQKDHGRPRLGASPKLYGLMDWLAYKSVVPSDVHLQLWLALGFLAVCMVDIVGLLLAKFLRRSGEISVRRALGAQKRDIFFQFGIEAAVIGLVGGALGVLIAELGLWSVRQRPDAYAKLAQMDGSMLLGTVALALGASVLAGLLPAWRACRIAPALQLKTL